MNEQVGYDGFILELSQFKFCPHISFSDRDNLIHHRQQLVLNDFTEYYLFKKILMSFTGM